MPALITVVVLLVLVAAVGILAFNGLVRARNRNREAWSQIDVELKRRHDLIPNLVETVKGYAAHERATFDSVTAARAGAINARATRDPAAIGSAENALTGSLRTLFAVAESYPQLRAVEGFLQLQEQLTATEDKLEYARRFYNTSARDYNTAIQTFPRNLIADSFGFTAVGYFQADDADHEVPAVTFGSAPTDAPPAASAATSTPGPSGPRAE
jgi:LemA protein